MGEGPVKFGSGEWLVNFTGRVVDGDSIRCCLAFFRVARVCLSPPIPYPGKAGEGMNL